MSKLTIVIAVVLVVAFIGITLKTMVQKIQAPTPNSNTNTSGNDNSALGLSSNFEELFGGLNNASSGSGNANNNANTAAGTTTQKCIDDLIQVKDEPWYGAYLAVQPSDPNIRYKTGCWLNDTLFWYSATNTDSNKDYYLFDTVTRQGIHMVKCTVSLSNTNATQEICK